MKHKLYLMVIASLFVLGSRTIDYAAEPDAKGAPASETIIPLQWLDKQTTIEQVESEKMVDAKSDAWKQMKASLQPGDALWKYCSSWESFQALAGRCGVALVRNGRVVNVIVTMMN